MTNEERISIFVKEIEKEALNKKADIVKEGENRIKTLFEGGKPAINSEAELYYRNECNRLLKENAQGVAKENAVSRRSIILKRNEITDEVFKSVLKKIKNFTNTNDYKEYVKTAYDKITAEYGNVEKVFIRECDEALIKNILPCEVDVDKEIILGGFKAKIDEGTVIDFTFDCRVEKQKEEFTKNSGLIVL